jgi:hypothetical protein
MQHRARSIAVLAGALSIGAATVATGAASAAAVPRAAARALARASGGSAERALLTRSGELASPLVRTVGDGAFRITRTIRRVDGSDHVVFTATDLRSGRTSTLNTSR